MTAIAHHPHQVATAIADARANLAEVASVPVWSMDDTETSATINDLTALSAQVAELQARVLAHADQIDLAANSGMSNTANWHAHHTHTTRPTAFRTMHLATGLETHELTRTALAAGRLHAEQALVIVQALAELPEDLDPAQMTKAEDHLIELAADHDAKALKVLGRRVLEVIDPDAADAHEAKLLEREERDAQAATKLTLWDNGHGRVHGKFTVDALTGAMLKKALLALAAPKHRASHGPLGERRPSPERMGQAFTELIQRYPTKKLPKAGGLNATIVVTMTLDGLKGGLKAAHLDTGGVISASLARRLACEAGIIPTVLGGQSQVLDLGRTRRFASNAQRIAKTIQAGGCEIDGCDTPPAMNHLHHLTRWTDGGRTDLEHLIMACGPHHARAHDPTYTMTRLPTGKYTFHRRT